MKAATTIFNNMIKIYKNAIVLKRPTIWNTLGLKRNQFLVFKFVYSDWVMQIDDLKKILTEVFSIIPGIPVIFPVSQEMPVFFIDQLNAPNLYLATSLDYSEINYLLSNSLALITAQACINEEIVAMNVNCLTNSTIALN
jgi:UDP-N-acetylglucosamine 2-epimerase